MQLFPYLSQHSVYPWMLFISPVLYIDFKKRITEWNIHKNGPQKRRVVEIVRKMKIFTSITIVFSVLQTPYWSKFLLLKIHLLVSGAPTQGGRAPKAMEALHVTYQTDIACDISNESVRYYTCMTNTYNRI